MIVKVFNMAASVQEGQPEVEWSRPRNAVHDWLRIGQMVDGTLPPDRALLASVDVEVVLGSKSTWEVVDFDGKFLVSGRCRHAIESLPATKLEFFDMKVNGQPWSVMVNRNVIDCVDRSRAVVEMKKLGNAHIPLIKRYEFHEDRIPDPAIFTIPECRHLTYCTQGVVSAIEAAGIKGFVFIDTQNPGKWAGMIGDR